VTLDLRVLQVRLEIQVQPDSKAAKDWLEVLVLQVRKVLRDLRGWRDRKEIKDLLEPSDFLVIQDPPVRLE